MLGRLLKKTLGSVLSHFVSSFPDNRNCFGIRMKPLTTLLMAMFYINYSHNLGNIANPLTLTYSVILTSIRLTMTIRDVHFAQHDTLLSK